MVIRFKDITSKAKPYILEGFRKAFRYSELYKNCLKKARIESHRINKDGNLSKRLKVDYKCAKCGVGFPQGQINVDHITPVVPLEKSVNDMTLSEYYTGCFTDVLQVLCKPCHKIKTKEENVIRANIRVLRKYKDMIEEDIERGYELIQAIIQTELIAKKCHIDSDLEMYKASIEYYEKELKKIYDRYEEK